MDALSLSVVSSSLQQFYEYSLSLMCSVAQSCSRLFATLWTAAWQAPLSVEFSRQG